MSAQPMAAQTAHDMEDIFHLHARWRGQPFWRQISNSELFGLLFVDIMSQHIPPGDILDCGCNIGQLVIHLGATTNLWNKKIVAIDPNGRYKDIIEASFKSYHIANSSFINAAISDFDGKGYFLINRQSEQLSRLAKAAECDPNSPDAVPIDCLSIDTLCAQRDLQPAVIKLDVEQGECQALVGANNVLKKFRPIVLFEWGMNSNTAEDSERVFDLFDDLNYTIIDHFGFVYDRELWAAHRTREIGWNRYAFPSEHNSLTDFIRTSFKAVHCMYGFNY